MKKSRVAALIAVPLLALSSMAHAAASVEPMQLTAAQMDDVTAGRYSPPAYPWWFFASYNKTASVAQINASPVTIIQIGKNNNAIVYSGNFSWLYQ